MHAYSCDVNGSGNLLSSIEKSHWDVSNTHVYTLEATAYSLLALVKTEVSKNTAAAHILNENTENSYTNTSKTNEIVMILLPIHY